MPTTDPLSLDPLRAILGVLAARNDANLFVNAITAGGITVDLAVDGTSVPASTRIAILLPRVLAVCDDLDPNARVTAAQGVLAGIGDRHLETRAKAIAQLALIGWEVLDQKLVVNAMATREAFFPAGSQWDAHVALKKVFATATHRITVIDGYADETIYKMLSSLNLTGFELEILCSTRSKYRSSLAAEGRRFQAQHGLARLEVRETLDFHDRFIVIDGRDCVHVGASIKDAGNTAFMVSAVEDPSNRAAVLQALTATWTSATLVP